MEDAKQLNADKHSVKENENSLPGNTDNQDKTVKDVNDQTTIVESEENKLDEDKTSMKTDDQKFEDSAMKKDSMCTVEEQQKDVAKKDYVVYKFRDRNKMMVNAWQEAFKDYKDRVEISHGDIFRDGPAAEALVSPANSFGFMDGGIDMAYSIHFGWQMQERLQKIIVNEKHGELLVGDAVIMPTFEGGAKMDSMDWSMTNEGQPIKWLISAPTMRVPMNVEGTVNAYLAFRAVLLAVQAHNRDESKEKITSVLMPGLGTAVGRMPPPMCAYQMLQAYETFELDLNPTRVAPEELFPVAQDHLVMTGMPED